MDHHPFRESHAPGDALGPIVRNCRYQGPVFGIWALATAFGVMGVVSATVAVMRSDSDGGLWLVFAFFLGMAGWLPWRLRAVAAVRVEEHHNGLRRRTRSQIEEIAWADVSRHQVRILRGSRGRVQGVHHDLVSRLSGKPVTFSSTLDHYDLLLIDVEAAVLRVLLPRARDQLLRGEALEFGAVTLTNQTVSVRGKELPWSHLARVERRAGLLGPSVVVHALDRPFAEVNYDDVFNLEVLIALVDELKRPPADAASKQST